MCYTFLCRLLHAWDKYFSTFMISGLYPRIYFLYCPSVTLKLNSKGKPARTQIGYYERIIWSTRYNAKNNDLWCYSKWRKNAFFNNIYKINMLLFVCINQFMPLLLHTNGNVLFSSSSLCILSSACMKRIAIAINVVPWTQYTTQCWQTETLKKYILRKG